MRFTNLTLLGATVGFFLAFAHGAPTSPGEINGIDEIDDIFNDPDFYIQDSSNMNLTQSEIDAIETISIFDDRFINDNDERAGGIRCDTNNNSPLSSDVNRLIRALRKDGAQKKCYNTNKGGDRCTMLITIGNNRGSIKICGKWAPFGMPCREVAKMSEDVVNRCHKGKLASGTNHWANGWWIQVTGHVKR
ncbi:hypothetical protein EDC01DRAFT_632076 [Geopyxis carbonaria]|nr:hypothetical protein EDC01DRAFT_632076 [Geopyxis carbonaria]